MCRQRLTLSREELRRTRQVELDRLLQRYQNMKSAVETQQNIEKQKIVRPRSTPLLPLDRLADCTD